MSGVHVGGRYLVSRYLHVLAVLHVEAAGSFQMSRTAFTIYLQKVDVHEALTKFGSPGIQSEQCLRSALCLCLTTSPVGRTRRGTADVQEGTYF